MKIGKKIVSIVLALVLVLGLMPAMKVVAANTLDMPIRFSSEKVMYGSDAVTEAEGESPTTIAAGATYTKAVSGGVTTYTLTLDNVNMTVDLSGEYAGAGSVIETNTTLDDTVNLIIVLKGTNTISSPTSGKSGIDVWNGTLTLKKADEEDSASLSVSSIQWCVHGAKGVEINGLSLELNSEEGGLVGTGSDKGFSGCDVTITNSSISTTKCGGIAVDAGNQNDSGDIIITNSDVTVPASAGASQILRTADGNITFTGDAEKKSTLDVTANAGISTSSGNNISISNANGNIIATGAQYSGLTIYNPSNGTGNVSITNSNLVITGGRSGVYTKSLNVTGIKGEDNIDIKTTGTGDASGSAIELNSGTVTSDSKIQASNDVSGTLADATVNTLAGKRRVVFFKEQPTVTFTAVESVPIFIAGTAKENAEIGTVATVNFDEGVTCTVQFYKSGHTGEFGNTNISGTVDSDGKVKVTTTNDTPAGTYYFNVKATKDDVTKTTANYSVTVLNSTISTVSLSIPSSLTVGSTYDAVKALFKVSEGAIGYRIKGSVAIDPHDLSKKYIEDENEPTSIQNNRVYRVSFQIEPEEGLHFGKGAEKTESNWYSEDSKVYNFTGHITGTPYDVVILEDGVLLVGYEYTVQNSSGYFPSSGVTSTTTNPENTIPVTGNENASVSVNVSNGNASIGEITDAVIDAADGNSTEDTNISIDVSSLNSVDSATLSKESVEKITDAVNDGTNSIQGLEVNFAGGTAEFDAVAVNSINNQATGNITISIAQIAVTTLNTAQQNAVSDKTVATVIKATVTSNGVTISSFSGGTQTISVNVNLNGRDGNYFHAMYVASNGTTAMQTTYFANGMVNFTTNHNSEFVIVYDETTKNNQPVNVYRAYNPKNGDHFLTSSKAEYDRVIKLGWRDEKVAFTAQSVNGNKVYRLYNPNTGEHFYTGNTTEKNKNVKDGWRYEGSMFVSAGETKVYRVYNPNKKSNNHLFTTNKAEYERLITLGWRDEGIAFMAN